MTVDTIKPSSGNGTVALLDSTNDQLVRLAQWVEAASNAQRLVAPLVNTAFVPDAYKPKVDPRATAEVKQAAYDVAVANATAAVLQGLSLGLDPLVSLQQIYIVHGRPGMYAKLMVALIQSHGHEVWTEDNTDTRAVVCGRRRGTDYIERVAITMDQARRAGWTKNDTYAKTPADMLWARAASRVCDRVASDVLKGIAAVEQINDENAITSEGSGIRTVTPRKRAAAELPVRPADPEPPLEASAPAETTTPPAEPGITKQQMTLLHKLLADNGYKDRDEGLKYLSQQVERTLTSSKELTKREASKVIDRLNVPEEPELDEAVSTLDADDLEWPEAAEVSP